VTFASVAAGYDHSCGLTADGTAYCWGNNRNGQLGDGTMLIRTSPTLVALNLKFRKIFTGISQTCGITLSPAGKLYCWGTGGNGQLGIGGASSASTPTAVNSSLAFASVVFGWDFACGLTTTGETHCWGTGRYGTLGTGVPTTSNQGSPIRLAGDPGFVSLAAGFQHACGVTAARVTYCWGSNRYGALTAEVIAPSSVSGSTVFRGAR
jgi:alpha-tubulin suppressor-like RCC1 family protein